MRWFEHYKYLDITLVWAFTLIGNKPLDDLEITIGGIGLNFMDALRITGYFGYNWLFWTYICNVLQSTE
jgi:hypothetical protein